MTEPKPLACFTDDDAGRNGYDLEIQEVRT